MKKRFAFFSLAFVLSFSALGQDTLVQLSKGLIIKNSCKVAPGKYVLGNAEGTGYVILISGENITIDFQQAELRSPADINAPQLFTGIGIMVKGKNITLKNAIAQGFKIGLMADSVENLRLDHCDFSYNYRPRLRSIREREDFSDWLSYHHNENDEWQRYGAGIYLKNCTKAVVKACRVTGCQNALLMSRCDDATVYNNFFCFNSGLGIGLYRSSRNKLMHNRLDWNVRGYSHGFYERGQDSAGILLYEQSSNNTIAYNSVTHSGDGLFLWAGQSTMDSGEGGCNDNWIYGNDFSYAPTNGIEVTFSRNRIQANVLKQCTYGIWGGYSYETFIAGNYLDECKTGIAIEHGQNDTIQRNLFQDDTIGINLWARETQPSDWGYAQKRDTRSRDALIDKNVFLNVRKPLKISNSQNISVNGENLFFDFEKLLETPKPNENLKFYRNDLYGTEAEIAEVWAHPEIGSQKNLNFSHPGKEPENAYAPLDIPVRELHEPDSLPDGIVAQLPRNFPRGREFILIDEWGPFDFRRPIAALDTVAGNRYSLVLIGPSGDWKVGKTSGVKSVSVRKGTVPATLMVERDPASDGVYVEFEYSSPQTIRNEFGEYYAAGKPYKFDFQRFEKKFDWMLNFYTFKDSLPEEQVFSSTPVLTQKSNSLAYAWWGSPGQGVPEDKFADSAETSFDIAPGTYTIELSSDDGARLYLDGKRLIDHWNIHEPETDEIEVTLGGHHQIRIEHFDGGGFATLDFRIKPKR